MSYHRLRYDSEAEAHAALVAAGIERDDGVPASGIAVTHLGFFGHRCAKASCNTLGGTCHTRSTPCPAQHWHVDVITPGDEPLPGEIVVSSPKHTFL